MHSGLGTIYAQRGEFDKALVETRKGITLIEKELARRSDSKSDSSISEIRLYKKLMGWLYSRVSGYLANLRKDDEAKVAALQAFSLFETVFYEIPEDDALYRIELADNMYIEAFRICRMEEDVPGKKETTAFGSAS